MKIALLGYGKMGQMVHQLAKEAHHEVLFCLDQSPTAEETTAFKANGVEVVIDFTQPDVAAHHVAWAIAHQLPLVVGTTGWYQEAPRLQHLCAEKNGKIMVGTNFSPGVNLLFAFNRHLAKWFSDFPAYTPSIHEIHHLKKLDQPSGTALTLAKGLSEVAFPHTSVPPFPFPVTSERIGEVPGTHTITWKGPHDALHLTHEAFSRAGFASGALAAAQWLLHQKAGWYEVEEMYAFQS